MVQDIVAEVISWIVPDVAGYVSRLICPDKEKRAKLTISIEKKRSKRRARRRARRSK